MESSGCFSPQAPIYSWHTYPEYPAIDNCAKPPSPFGQALHHGVCCLSLGAPPKSSCEAKVWTMLRCEHDAASCPGPSQQKPPQHVSRPSPAGCVYACTRAALRVSILPTCVFCSAAGYYPYPPPEAAPYPAPGYPAPPHGACCAGAALQVHMLHTLRYHATQRCMAHPYSTQQLVCEHLHTGGAMWQIRTHVMM